MGGGERGVSLSGRGFGGGGGEGERKGRPAEGGVAGRIGDRRAVGGRCEMGPAQVGQVGRGWSECWGQGGDGRRGERRCVTRG